MGPCWGLLEGAVTLLSDARAGHVAARCANCYVRAADFRGESYADFTGESFADFTGESFADYASEFWQPTFYTAPFLADGCRDRCASCGYDVVVEPSFGRVGRATGPMFT